VLGRTLLPDSAGVSGAAVLPSAAGQPAGSCR